MKRPPLDPFGRSIGAILLVALTAACGGGDAGAGTTATTVEVSTTVATSTTPDTSGDYIDKNDSPVTTGTETITTTTTTEAVTTTTVPATTTSTPTTSTSGAATTTSAPAAGRTVTVSTDSFSFSPSTITINVGDTVQWFLSGGTHTTTSGSPPTPDGNWNQVITAEAPVDVTFDQAGQFPFFCRFHPDFMTGVVVVEP